MIPTKNPLEFLEKQQQQLIIFSLIVLVKPFLKVIYQIIFLFVSWFHRHKMVKHTRNNSSVKADELFECV